MRDIAAWRIALTFRSNPFNQDRWIGLMVSLTFFAAAFVAFFTGQVPEAWSAQVFADASLSAKSTLFGAFMCCLGLIPLGAFMPGARQALGWATVWALCSTFVYMARG